jgi:hypothetical protein
MVVIRMVAHTKFISVFYCTVILKILSGFPVLLALLRRVCCAIADCGKHV